MSDPTAKSIEDAAEPMLAADQLAAAQLLLLRELDSALDNENVAAVTALVSDLHDADVADVITLLPRDSRHKFMAMMAHRLAPEVFIEMDQQVLTDLLHHVPPPTIAAAISELETDEGVYLLESMEAEHRELVLAEVPLPDRAAVMESLAYPEDSAGRLVQRDLIAVPAFWTVGQVIDYCRDNADLPDEFYEVFVVDPRHKPVGQVPLSRIMRSKRPVMIRDLLGDENTTVPAAMDQEDVALLFRKYRLTSAPVVDETGRLLGVVTFDDIAEVIEEEAEEDLMRLVGVGEEGDLNEPVLRTARTRFAWLLVNLFTAVAASLVIAQFDATLQQIVAVAILMPIVASMGGNAGTQTLTVAVRALATRELTSANAGRIVMKELVVGGVNGLLFAVLIGIIAAVWFSDLALGLVIAVAMAVNMVIAGAFGALVPLGLDKMGADPAIAATVVLTTITDVVGFFSFLGLAALFLM